MTFAACGTSDSSLSKASAMNSRTDLQRPPVRLLEFEADNLTNLALSAAERGVQAAELLLDEIARAEMFKADRLPTGIVTMNSVVEFRDEASGSSRTVQLVYPGEADISAGRISILTPVGAGLIGLGEGHVIHWPDREGRERPLIILKVTQPDRL